MYNCFDVAKEFLDLAKKEGEGIDTMKLLKLTYISQGYYLGFFSKPLYYNQVQAWKYGPVIPELYHVIKRFGTGYVDPSTISLYSENKLSDADKEFISIIWKNYKKFNGLQLSTKTHESDTPWAKAYKDNETGIVIDNEIIEDYYKKLINAKKD